MIFDSGNANISLVGHHLIGKTLHSETKPVGELRPTGPVEPRHV